MTPAATPAALRRPAFFIFGLSSFEWVAAVLLALLLTLVYAPTQAATTTPRTIEDERVVPAAETLQSAPPAAPTAQDAPPAQAARSGRTLAAAQTEAVNESPRERQRLLLKRNPIASEYQVVGSFGRSPGAQADAESVGFGRFFPLMGGSETTRVQLSATRQHEAGVYEPGGRIDFARALGADAESARWHIAARLSRNAARRVIDEYAGRWNVRSDIGGVPSLTFPRYTTDQLDTTTTGAIFRLGFEPSDRLEIAYQTNLIDYQDKFHRNRVEFQFARGTPDPDSLLFTNNGQTLAAGTFSDGAIRRYFHDNDTDRSVQRHQLNFRADGERRALSGAFYLGKWDNSRDWDGWNFLQRGVDMAYATERRWRPTLSTREDFDLYAVDDVPFANLRLYDINTIDRDRALRLDWEQQFAIAGHQGWWSTGLQWRTKARDNDEQRLVFLAGEDTFDLADFPLLRETDDVLDGDYRVPADLNVGAANQIALAAEGAELVFSEALSFSESVQSQFTSEETVSAAFVSAYQQLGRWRWKAGLRYELTETETLGSIVAPEDFVASARGIPVTELTVQGRELVDSFDSFGAKRVPGGQRYDHWLPNLELSFAPTDQLTLSAAYYRALMRPQYFDIVDYRRVILPIFRIQEGNPELTATTIDSLAVAFEYRSARFGTLAAEWYYKDVVAFFYDAISNEVIDDVLFDVTRVENGGDGMIQGFQVSWEVSAENPLPFLDQLNFSSAYTYSQSEADIADASGATRTISMPERSRHLLNSRISVSKGPFRAGLNGSYQSQALDRVGNADGRDRIRRYYVQVGANLGLRFGQGWDLGLTLSNLTNHPERSFDGESRRVLLNQYSFASAALTLSKQL
ncbi:MAG: TonB-dependent receptor [Pseudomonadota bacterium]